MIDDAPDLEIVLETMDLAEMEVVKSLLKVSGVPYVIRAEDAYDQFRGVFRATVFSPSGRPVEFLVPAHMARDVRQLLANHGY